MARLSRAGCMVLVLALALTACGAQGVSVEEQQALDLAWQALEPNTSSHDRANWEVTGSRQVSGREVAEQFAGASNWGCPGPTPPPDGEIEPAARYWFVEMKKRPATPKPAVGTASPTAPPRVPEPFIYQALFLIGGDGQVVARRLFCVVY